MALDLICLSHLRWDFVYQRPHHLMSRFARGRRVFYVEEPVLDTETHYLEAGSRAGGVQVVVPHVPDGLDAARYFTVQRELLDGLLEREAVRDYVLWYYTPMALEFTRHLHPAAVVYDCMDELAAFALAASALRANEQALFQRADLVFTGGRSLYEAKRTRHPSVYCFPSGVELEHFGQARRKQSEPADQAAIGGPRIGFFGVIDERMDLDLVRSVADARPDWQLVLIGPTAKIGAQSLPRRQNIHYLGAREYRDLPAYLSSWDVAMLPFARNHATRFISPTKTPEYLAAGLPVVSTSIRDVVEPYGKAGLVRIADSPAGFVAAVEAAMTEDRGAQIRRVDDFLQDTSWDRTWEQMNDLIAPLLCEAEIGESEIVEEEVSA